MSACSGRSESSRRASASTSFSSPRYSRSGCTVSSRAWLLLPALAARVGRPAKAPPAQTASAAPATPPKTYSHDPYPSTYHRYPGVLTAITGGTVFDGEGGRIENGVVILADGVVQAIGGPATPIPDGATRIDAHGKWVTPGVIDIHSHLG